MRRRASVGPTAGTTTSTEITLGLQGFLLTPAAADLEIVLTDPVNSNSQIAIQQATLTADGSLALVLAAGAITRPTGANLSVLVKLGNDTLPCLGFKSCSAMSTFVRGFAVDIPYP